MDEKEVKETDEIIYWNKFRNGDDKSFKQLYNLFSDRLYRYGIKFTDNDMLVEDCIQELFIKLYKIRYDLPAVESPLSYLFSAMKNRLIDMLRQNERLVYISHTELPFMAEFSFDAEEDNPETEIKEKFEKVMAQLSNRQKEAIYLRYQMGLSYEKIAQLLEINYQSTRNLIHRAIKKIRSEIDLGIFLILFLKYIT